MAKTKILDSEAFGSALESLNNIVMKKSSDLPLKFDAIETMASAPTVTNGTALGAQIVYIPVAKKFYAKKDLKYYNNWPGRDMYCPIGGAPYRKLFYTQGASGYELYTADSEGNLIKIPSDYYNKTEIDNKLAAKANTSTTYTKTEVDNKLAAKANTSDVYTKTQSDTNYLKTADYTVMTAQEASDLVNELFN